MFCLQKKLILQKVNYLKITCNKCDLRNTTIRTHDTIIRGSSSSERQPKTQSGFTGSNINTNNNFEGGNIVNDGGDVISANANFGGNNVLNTKSNFESRDPFAFPNSIADIITGDDTNFVRTTRNQNQGSYTPSFAVSSNAPAGNYNGGGGSGGSPAPGPTSGQFKYASALLTLFSHLQSRLSVKQATDNTHVRVQTAHNPGIWRAESN